MSNLSYRGTQSLTFKLVLLGFTTGTGLLIGGYITGSEWVTGVLGLVASYVIKEAANVGAEAYRDKGKPESTSA